MSARIARAHNTLSKWLDWTGGTVSLSLDAHTQTHARARTHARTHTHTHTHTYTQAQARLSPSLFFKNKKIFDL